MLSFKSFNYSLYELYKNLNHITCTRVFRADIRTCLIYRCKSNETRSTFKFHSLISPIIKQELKKRHKKTNSLIFINKLRIKHDIIIKYRFLLFYLFYALLCCFNVNSESYYFGFKIRGRQTAAHGQNKTLQSKVLGREMFFK